MRRISNWPFGFFRLGRGYRESLTDANVCVHSDGLTLPIDRSSTPIGRRSGASKAAAVCRSLPRKTAPPFSDSTPHNTTITAWNAPLRDCCGVQGLSVGRCLNPTATSYAWPAATPMPKSFPKSQMDRFGYGYSVDEPPNAVRERL